jgi:hypothetical protein
MLMGAAALGIVVVVVWAARSSSVPSPRQVAPDTKVFSVAGRPTLVFRHAIGSVHVTPGPDGQVRIQETRNGITDAIVSHYTQRGDAITTTVDIPTGLYLDTWVDFNVAVPRHAGVTVAVATGTLTVRGLTGDTTLSDRDGAIWASGLSGSTALRTGSGSISADRLSGQLAAATDNGTIAVTRTRLSGRSTIQARSGTIDFHGSLDRHGTFAFKDSNGAIGVTLSPDSTFQLQARTGGGSINADLPAIRTARASAGAVATGAVGAAPRPLLTIENGSGSIDLWLAR